MNNKPISNTDNKTLSRVDQVLENSNLHYHSLFEQATDAIMVTDFNGNFKDVNSSLCAMFGYTKEELLQLNVKALLDPEHLKAKPIRFDLLAVGQNTFNERKMVHKNGTIIYVEANAKKFAEGHVMAIARDISARKKVESTLQKSQAHLQAIFDTTDTIYVLIDNDLRVVSYNSRAVAFAENELGHSMNAFEYFLDYFPSERKPVLLNYIKQAQKGEHINYQVSYPQAGSFFNWYNVKIFPISKDDTNVYGVMMAVEDITEKRRLETELEEERIKKQQEITDAVITAEENERREIGTELHDNVNQLLASSRFFLSLARKEEVKDHHPNLDEMDTLIKGAIAEIRNLSHALVSPFAEGRKLLDALDHLTTMITKSSAIIIKKEFSLEDENKIPEKLRLSLYRIVQEQLNNILKYASAKEVYIKLVEDNKGIILSVKDNGVGFDTAKTSTGIGLMNIRTRASLFNGKVAIISSPGNGCELLVTFD